MCKLEILYFDRINVSVGIDVNKNSESKQYYTYHYWYFLDKGFKIQPDVYNRFQDFLMMSMNLSNITILNIKGANYS